MLIKIPRTVDNITLSRCLPANEEHSPEIEVGVKSHMIEDHLSINSGKRSSSDEDKKKKVVSFNLKVITTGILHRNNYTEEEKRQCWYTESDVLRIKGSIEPIVRLMKSGELKQHNNKQHNNNNNEKDEEEIYCTRGLEHRVYDRAMERRGHRMKGRIAVLEEQDRQIMLHGLFSFSNGDDEIACRYALVSKYCAFKAHEVGIMDEDEVSAENGRAAPKKSSSSSMIEMITENWTFVWGKKGENKKSVQSSLNMSGMSVLFHNYLCS